MDVYAIEVNGLEELTNLEDLEAKVVLAAVRAINRTTERTKTASAKEIRKQVNFPARYLSGETGRLKIQKKATSNNLEAMIKGRERPTSLARFVTSGTVGKAGVTVQIQPGRSIDLKKAFLLRLPQGSTLTDTKANLGLAIRLRDGERIANKKHLVRAGRGLYLLYGPSVNQVFAEVASEQSGSAADFLEREFLRLVNL